MPFRKQVTPHRATQIPHTDHYRERDGPLPILGRVIAEPGDAGEERWVATSGD